MVKRNLFNRIKLIFFVGLLSLPTLNTANAQIDQIVAGCKEYLQNGNSIDNTSTGLCVGIVKGVADGLNNYCRLLRIGHKNGAISDKDFESRAIFFSDVDDVTYAEMVESYLDIWEKNPEMRDAGITGTTSFWLTKKWPCKLK